MNVNDLYVRIHGVLIILHMLIHSFCHNKIMDILKMSTHKKVCTRVSINIRTHTHKHTRTHTHTHIHTHAQLIMSICVVR